MEVTNPKKQRPSWPPPKICQARNFIYLLIIGLAVHILLPQIASLKDSIAVLRSMSPWLLSLAFLAQVCSYLGSGYLVKSIVDLGRSKLSFGRGLLIAFASGSIGLVGGWVGAGTATYRWVGKGEHTSDEAILAGMLPPLFNEIVLVSVTIIGLVYLLIDFHLARAQVISYSLLLSVVALTLLVIIFAVQNRAKIEPFISRSADRLMHFLRWTYDATALQNAIDNLYRGLALLDNKGSVRPALGAALNVGFDMLTLYFIFLAAGYKIHPGVLLAGYGLAFLVGKIAYILPGGVGIIEGSMAAVYSSLGVPTSVSVVVILSYRLFSFWIPTLFGFAVAGYLEKEANSEDLPKVFTPKSA